MATVQPSAPEQRSQPIWVWKSVGDEKAEFVHPSDIPVSDEALANERFIQNKKGPKIMKLSPATLLQIDKQKDNIALIAENGATREVVKTVVVPWYEGLLLVERLETTTDVAWVDDKLRDTLGKERQKFTQKQVSSALYVEKRLISTAVTGRRFVDANGKEWLYRRENVSSIEKELPVGQDADGFFKVREIVGYLPPWDAFCHEKCGFYQDFYEVKWDGHYSEIDYSDVENGSTENKGCTWEPDECLPAHLDAMRVAAKKAWVRKRKEQEQLRDQKAKAAAAPPAEAPSSAKLSDKAPSSSKTPEKLLEPPPVAAAVQPPVKKAKVRRDGQPLERDILMSAKGHDFVPVADAEKKFGGIASSWPKYPQDYPKGYGVANPPGFCWSSCNCMDDQRPQHLWETTKQWLDNFQRSSSSQKTIDHFTENGQKFSRKRGSVSRMFYFETLNTTASSARASHSRSALDLAESLEKALKATIKTIPMHSLSNRAAPVRIPAKAFVKPDQDYDPLEYHARLADGERLPSWLSCHADTGVLTISDYATSIKEPLELKVQLGFAEGVVSEADCSITPEQLRGSTSPWAKATVAIVQLFLDEGNKLEKSYLDIILEHMEEVYDFNSRTVKDVALGEWLEVISRVLCMLRATAVSNIVPRSSNNGNGSLGV